MQLGVFEPVSFFPRSYDDIQLLHDTYIHAPSNDSDSFTFSEIQNGRSYSFYGQKLFEFYPPERGPARLRVPGYFFALLGMPDSDKKDDLFYTLSERNVSPDVIRQLFVCLDHEQQKIFRGLTADIFLCCNDFKRCSDQKSCLHSDNRLYNGCAYRTNLEAGRIFFGKNCNVEVE